MKRIAVVLAGNGVYDGAEIHEAVLTLWAIDKWGANYQCFAPDMLQAHVVNHITGEDMNETRNVLVEAARIARGNIKPLSEYKVDEFDALIFPGGFGAAKNLCTFAFDGTGFKVNTDVQNAVIQTFKEKKPIGALCISPVILARLVQGVKITVGDDAGTIEAVESLGAKHVITTHGQILTDETNKVVTTPCYMLNASISQIATGADNLVGKILGMC
jgi:enhancing lycopene biosynthesis protein 2